MVYQFMYVQGILILMSETNLKSNLIGQREIRLSKLARIKELGINPYPAKTYKQYNNGDIVNNFEKYDGKEAILGGRITAWREHGKLIFAVIKDESGSIQVMIRKDSLHEDLSNGMLGWDNLELLDISDFIEVSGTIGKTRTGEISIMAEKIRLLTKALRPMPKKLKNKEQMFRRRYLDLNISPERKDMFRRKAQFWQVQRNFLKDQGFMEVEVPVLELVTGGADATPFVTHHNALHQDLYLRISTELFQKRLLGGGYEKIYTLGPNFRNEGMDDEHLQEYYQLEWYWAYADFRDNMKLAKELFLEIAQKVYGKTKFSTRGHTFDLAGEWKEIDYAQLLKDKFGVDIFNADEKELLSVVEKNNIAIGEKINRNRLVDALWKTVRSTIDGPVFLINQPAFLSPLAKVHENDKRVTERFQIIIAGSELGNGYSEINDPLDQLDRFLEQQKLREEGDSEAHMLDIDFVEMLEYGMPPASGYGQSERIFWFLENVTGREGTFFPQVKNEIDNTTKEIYKDKVKFSQKKQ